MLVKPAFATFQRRFFTFSLLLLLATAIWSAYSQQYPSSAGGDDVVEHTPDRIYDGHVYRSGHIPIWNPYLFSGVDQPSVIQPGVFYPPNIVLYAIFSGVVAHNLMIVAHILLAFYFMRQFLKLHNLTDWAATLGALTLVFGSVTICFIEAVPNSNARVWVIAAFYFLEKWIQSRRIIFCARMGACIALILLAGWPQTVVLGGVYLMVYALLSLPGYAKKKWLIGGFVAAFLFSAVVGMVQILPTLELKQHSNLSETSYGFFGTCAVPPVLFVELLIPFLFGCGKPLLPVRWLGPVNVDVMQIYVGILPLLLLPTALLFWKKSRPVRFAAVAFVMSLLLAAATYTPLGHLLYLIPAYNFFRDHYYHFYFTTFAIGILTAAAISALEEREVSESLRRRLAWIVPAAFVLAFATILMSRHSLLRILQRSSHVWWPGYHIQGHLALKLTNPATIAAIAVLLVSIVPYALKLRYPASGRVNWLIVGTMVLVMGSYSAVIYAGPTSANPPASDAPIIARLKQLSAPDADRMYSAECCDRFLHIHHNEEIPVADIMGYGSLFPYPYTDLVELGGGGGSPSWAELMLNHRILSLLNVRYVIVDYARMEQLKKLMPLLGPAESKSTSSFAAGPNIVKSDAWVTVGNQASVSPMLTFSGKVDSSGVSISGVRQDGLQLTAKSVYELTFDYRPQNLDATGFGITLGSGDSTKHRFVKRLTIAAPTAPYSMIYITGEIGEVASLAFSGETPVPIEITNVELRRVGGLPLRESTYRTVVESEGMYLIENSDVLPRAFVAGEIRPAAQYAEARAALWSMTRELDLRSIALVEGWPERGPKRLSTGEVSDLRYGSGEVTLTANCKGECFVVLTDRYTPEWKAAIDGRPTKIYPTDGVVRGVLVPAGKHQVRLSYSPRFQNLALWMSGVTMLGLVLGTFLQLRRNQ